jgi:hypothetical protein
VYASIACSMYACQCFFAFFGGVALCVPCCFFCADGGCWPATGGLPEALLSLLLLLLLEFTGAFWSKSRTSTV